MKIIHVLPRRTHSHVLFWGHWNPCFGFLITSSLGSKPEWSALLALWRGMYIHSLRPTSAAMCCQPLDGQHCGNSRCQPNITAYWCIPQALAWSQNLAMCSSARYYNFTTPAHNRISRVAFRQYHTPNVLALNKE